MLHITPIININGISSSFIITDKKIEQEHLDATKNAIEQMQSSIKGWDDDDVFNTTEDLLKSLGYDIHPYTSYETIQL